MVNKHKSLLLFSPATYNLAETSRCLEIAKACRDDFQIVFMSAGGDFEKLIIEEKFQLENVHPRLTPEKVVHIYKIDQGEKFGAMFSRSEIEQYVASEISIINRYRPAAIITGFDFVANLSGKATNTPIIWISQSTWNMAKMMDLGLGSYPDVIDTSILKILPVGLKKWLAKQMVKWVGRFISKPFNKVARQYNLSSFCTLEDLWQGDYNLLAEPEDFSGNTSLPDNHFYIGPLIADIRTPLPEVIAQIPKDKPLVYFAMGSSGRPKVIKEIIEGFRGQPFYVIAPVQSKIQGLAVNIPENVFVVGWIPALEISKQADLSVIHGGVGTVMTAALSGKPVVGVGMMYEQEYNLECLVRKGIAVRLQRKSLSPALLNTAILRLLQDGTAQEKARQYQKYIESWHNYDRIRTFFQDHFQA